MHSIKISTATKADVAAIAHLFDAYRQFYQYPPDLALANRYIAERIEKADSLILLAQDASAQALGFCQLYPTFCSLEAKPIYALYDLYVAPAARGAGIGNLLLLAAEQTRSRDLSTRLQRELRRIGATVAFAGEQNAIQLVLSEMEIARTGRVGSAGGRR